MKHLALAGLLAALPLGISLAQAADHGPIALTYGNRPFFLIDKMEDGPLKEKLTACIGQTPKTTTFSIGHRGAPLQFPEHTVESNLAAARQGAGILECDVAFTADKELVCRHAQNDLHTTTNMVASDLAAKCTTPFSPAADGKPASAECRTSDITLAEFMTLQPKMDAADKTATTAEAYLGGVPAFRTTSYADGAHLMTHAQSIALFKELGAKFTPELKDPAVTMPFDGFTMDDYAQKMIDEYKAAGIPASDVFAQSFNLDVVRYWVENEPEFGKQAVFLVEPQDDNWDEQDPSTWANSPAEIAGMGINYLAPAIFMMLTLDENGDIVPSKYAEEAKAAGLKLIAWSLERSGPLATGGGWYYQSITPAIDTDADYYNVLNVLAQDVGVVGVFSDWPATVTYYANCYGL
ncbi:glycerophosphodiester phosphodiesterase family protein [Acuticoccus mangrovi]|uniref:glycerophosphodiester phosphodiesterase n=1 Tax=Acuticoccus mangrovi TaxID=2796142 RepID=A0A934IK70_9HYPH|nr:glycerophosphodiester phosphodiesterase family protein [Acuticoccus mangrovi]MBJ3775292.1 glycerophosphodiester phosphodiesterase [Acuticoccus mangrovi]